MDLYHCRRCQGEPAMTVRLSDVFWSQVCPECVNEYQQSVRGLPEYTEYATLATATNRIEADHNNWTVAQADEYARARARMVVLQNFFFDQAAAFMAHQIKRVLTWNPA